MPRSGLLLSRAVPRMVLPASALHLGHKTELHVFSPSGCYLRTDGVTVTHISLMGGCWALQAAELCPRSPRLLMWHRGHRSAQPLLPS